MRNNLVRSGLLTFTDQVKAKGYTYLQHISRMVTFPESVHINLYARYGWYTVGGLDGKPAIEETFVLATVDINPQREGWFKILLAETMQIAEADSVNVAVESVCNPHLATYLESQGFKLVPVPYSSNYYKRTRGVK